MKICLTCKRSYADELSFCLEDGTLLSAADAPDPVRNQEKTALLPGGLRPTEDATSGRRTAIESSTPAYSYPSPQFPEKRTGKPWVIIGAGVAICIVVLIALAGFSIWKAKSNAESSPAASNGPNRRPGDNTVPVTAPNVNRNSQSQTAETPNLEWLSGVWEGDAYQTDTRTRWAVRLTVRDETYSISYPDIPCQGTWKLIEKNSRSASFTEVITQGLDQCSNNSHVMIEKLSESEISCRYTHAGSRTVIATVVLTRKD